MGGPVSDSTPSGLPDLLREISSVVRTLDGELPDDTAQAALSVYAGQLRSLAAAQRSPNRLPRRMRFQLKDLGYGLQMLAGEIPGPGRGDLTTRRREVSQMLVVCRRDADKLDMLRE
jgi:hypothetical protein